MSFPVYLLWIGAEWQIVFPEDKTDIGHTDFWEQKVSYIVAQHFHIPQKKLANLPYSQRRARIVGDKIYYGERHDPELLGVIRKAIGDEQLIFAYDDHEKRLRADMMEYRKLVRCYRRRG